MSGQIKERFVDGSDGKLHLVKEQDCEGILRAIKDLPDLVVQKKLRAASNRLIGSVPNILAVAWAKEWGVRLYSREWLEMSMKRVKHDPNWSALRVKYK